MISSIGTTNLYNGAPVVTPGSNPQVFVGNNQGQNNQNNQNNQNLPVMNNVYQNNQPQTIQQGT
jgi:hypothetical protein